jgi:hypothetical protein
MKRSLVPSNAGDRLLAVTIPLSVVLLLLSLEEGAYWLAVLYGVMIAIAVTLAYAFQSRPVDSTSSSEYSRIIGGVELIGGQLSELGRFLEKERARIIDTEKTVRRLINEKEQLEPVINTQRETVEAILAAHAERTARNIWKERLIGFFLGVFASLLASFTYEYFKQ